jgi:hypothetical protein
VNSCNSSIPAQAFPFSSQDIRECRDDLQGVVASARSETARLENELSIRNGDVARLEAQVRDLSEKVEGKSMEIDRLSANLQKVT